MSVVQIAAQAGVSIATVSRVINNSRRVNPQLAEQVRRAMVELNLKPSQIRRRSSARRSDARSCTIAIVSLGRQYRGWFDMPVMASVVAELTRVGQEMHVGTLIAEMPDPSDPSPILRRRPVDGAIVFVDSGLPSSAADHLGAQMPIVRIMGGQLGTLKVDHVGPDNAAIGYLAGQTLLARGCRSLAFYSWWPGWDLSKLRGFGFASAAINAGIRPRAFVTGDRQKLSSTFGCELTISANREEQVQALATAIRGRSEAAAPFGLFTSRDEEAVLVQQQLTAMGFKPGRDPVIVSCDNEQVRLVALNPQPPSLDLNVAQIARHAVARLIHRMERPDEAPTRILVAPRLLAPTAAGVALEMARFPG